MIATSFDRGFILYRGTMDAVLTEPKASVPRKRLFHSFIHALGPALVAGQQHAILHAVKGH